MSNIIDTIERYVDFIVYFELLQNTQQLPAHISGCANLTIFAQ